MSENLKGNSIRIAMAIALSIFISGMVFGAAITVNENTTYQTIDGFGAFGFRSNNWSAPTDWWSDAFGNQIIGDLGLTIHRNEYYPPEPPNDQDTQFADQAPYFQLLRDKANQLGEPLKIIITVWTPPGYMKSNGSTKNGGNLLSSYYDDYGTYIADALDDFAGIGVSVYGWSLQNEPLFSETYNSCVYTAETYRDMLKIAGPIIHARYPNIKLYGAEHMMFGIITDWDWDNLEPIRKVKDDSAANAQMAIWAMHGYSDGVNPDPGSQGDWTLARQRLDIDNTGKHFWMTETSGFSDTWTGTSGAFSLGTQIFSGLKYGHLSAWVWWQLSEPGGGNYALMDYGTPNKKYYASKQFYRYIRPNAVMVDAGTDDSTVQPAAFTHSTNNTLTIVLINSATSSKTANLSVSGSIVPTSYTGYRTSSSENCVNIGTVTTSVTLPASSITTLYGTATGGTPPGQASSPSPANGATGVSVNADLSWTAGSGATSHDVYFGTDSTPDSGEFMGNQTGTSYALGTLTNSTTYYWRIDEKNAYGTTTGVVWSFTTAPAGGGLPSPWVSQDIGSPGAAGSASYNSGTFTVNGSGADIAGTSDAGQFVYQPASGDCEIVARVVSFSNIVADWAKAGIMIRESLNANSTFAFGNYTTNVANTVHSWTLLHRDTTGGSATQTVWGTDQVTPYWVRVVRSGNSFSGYVSSNGSSWTLITTATITMASNVYVGMAVTSHLAGSLSTATFDNVSVTTTAPPGQASNPSPANGATSVAITTDLSWTAGSGATSHDVYFGTTSPGTFRGNQAGTTYDTGTMANGTTYYWRIDEKNAAGTTTGVVWSFTTVALVPPGQASSPSPANGATSVGITTDLSWTAGSGATSHDVYFGTPTSPPFIQNQAGTTYDTGTMAYNTTYYWRIDEKNAAGTTTGVVWSFTTVVAPPGQASNPSPANGATSVAITTDLSWTAGSGATSHDVYFGTASPGTFRGNQAGTTYDTGTMTNNTTYYWRIDEKNAGGTTTGIVWSFTTIVNPPGQASNPSPANGATGVSTGVDITWTAGSGATSHDVYFGSITSPPFIQNQTATTYDPGTLVAGTSYYWRIDEKNAGGTTTGVVWSFVTGSGGGLPSPWLNQDIGSPGAAGSASYNSGTFTVNGSGADIAGTSDAGYFVYQPITGNCTITARVVSFSNIVADWAKAGVMIRESLNANSTFAFGNYTTNVANTVHSWTLLHRDTTGGTATQTVWGTDQVTPYWIRVVRSGNSFSGYVSSNGSSWTLITTATITMTSNVYVGMAVTSHQAGSISTATFDNVSVTTGAATPTYVAAGAVSSSSSAITPALPSGIATNDILLLFLETANQAISISNQNGGTWTAVTNSPQSTGGTRLTVFWSRYNGTQGAPTTSDSGDHQLGRMIAVRGAITSGNPWDVTAGGVEATSDTSGSIPGATTTVANTLVVAAIATDLPDASGTANFSAWANSNLTSVTERTDNTVTAGNGGGLGIATGEKVTAGAYGNTTVTCASSAVKGMMSIAIKGG